MLYNCELLLNNNKQVEYETDNLDQPFIYILLILYLNLSKGIDYLKISDSIFKKHVIYGEFQKLQFINPELKGTYSVRVYKNKELIKEFYLYTYV